MLTLWDYLKWILYALLLSVQLGFLFTLANTLGKPRVDEASIRVTSLAFNVLENIPLELTLHDLEKLGITEKGGVCMITPPVESVTGVYQIRIRTVEKVYACVWPERERFEAFETTSRVMPGYARIHSSFPLALDNTLAWVDLIVISKEGLPLRHITKGT